MEHNPSMRLVSKDVPAHAVGSFIDAGALPRNGAVVQPGGCKHLIQAVLAHQLLIIKRLIELQQIVHGDDVACTGKGL